MFGCYDAMRKEMTALTGIHEASLGSSSHSFQKHFRCDYCATLFTVEQSCGCGAKRCDAAMKPWVGPYESEAWMHTRLGWK